VRRVRIGKTVQLDELAHACGELYSKALVFFWRKGNEPPILDWPWELPQTVVIHWTGTQYEAIATYKQEEPMRVPHGTNVAGIDLREIHIAVSHDGEHTHILNGRLLRSKRQYRNKLIADLDSRISRKKKGSTRRKKLIRSKQKQLRKIKHQIQDIEHKSTTRLVSTLYEEGVQTLVIGNVRDIRSGMLSPSQEQAEGTHLPLFEQAVWLDLASRWSRCDQHQEKGSRGIWCPSRSWGHGTPHRHTVSAACWCSSLGESVPARKCLCG
jgi:transposase